MRKKRQAISSVFSWWKKILAGVTIIIIVFYLVIISNVLFYFIFFMLLIAAVIRSLNLNEVYRIDDIIIVKKPFAPEIQFNVSEIIEIKSKSPMYCIIKTKKSQYTFVKKNSSFFKEYLLGQSIRDIYNF